MQRELVAIIESLPRELSQIVVMAFVHKQRRAAIANALGITVSEVEQRQVNALMECRDRLEGRIDFEKLANALGLADPCQSAKRSKYIA